MIRRNFKSFHTVNYSFILDKFTRLYENIDTKCELFIINKYEEFSIVFDIFFFVHVLRIFSMQKNVFLVKALLDWVIPIFNHLKISICRNIIFQIKILNDNLYNTARELFDVPGVPVRYKYRILHETL